MYSNKTKNYETKSTTNNTICAFCGIWEGLAACGVWQSFAHQASTILRYVFSDPKSRGDNNSLNCSDLGPTVSKRSVLPARTLASGGDASFYVCADCLVYDINRCYQACHFASQPANRAYSIFTELKSTLFRRYPHGDLSIFHKRFTKSSKTITCMSRICRNVCFLRKTNCGTQVCRKGFVNLSIPSIHRESMVTLSQFMEKSDN
jgi:hypothetical protein